MYGIENLEIRIGCVTDVNDRTSRFWIRLCRSNERRGRRFKRWRIGGVRQLQKDQTVFQFWKFMSQSVNRYLHCTSMCHTYQQLSLETRGAPSYRVHLDFGEVLKVLEFNIEIPWAPCGLGHPSFPPVLIFSLSFVGFTYFLLLFIPPLSTRIVPLCLLFLSYLYSLVKVDSGVLFYLV